MKFGKEYAKKGKIRSSLHTYYKIKATPHKGKNVI